MIGKLKDLMKTRDGDWLVSFTTRVDPRPIFDQFTDKDVNVEIKKASKHRSKTANDFMWAMCTDIARVMYPPMTKEEVYRKAMNEVKDIINCCETMHMRAEAIPTFRELWSRNGTAWFTEVVDYSPIPGCKVVFAYKGSSMFSASDMSILIDNLKQEMVQQGLTIPISKQEEERLLAQWGKRNGETSKDMKDDTKLAV